jgi:hypothetical protein
MPPVDPVRAARLRKIFDSTCRGQRLTSRANSLLFLEAICAEDNKIKCINDLLSSPGGLLGLQAAVRLDLSITFLNGLVSDVIEYLSSPDVAALNGGDVLRPVVTALVDPPLFWSAYSQEFQSKQLDTKPQVAFVSLLYYALSTMPAEQTVALREFARLPDIIGGLLDSPQQSIRALAQKIKLVTDVRQAPTVIAGVSAAGGRHDNDHADFRAIAIVPTADELSCTETPFLRPSNTWDAPNEAGDGRPADYLDAQFRLLREDMLYEMREEIQAIQKRKKSRNPPLDGFRLADVHYEKVADPNSRFPPRPVPWSIALVHGSDIPQLAALGDADSKQARLAWLKKNSRFLKHGSLVGLFAEDAMVALATIHREEDLLADVPPVVIVRIEGEATVLRALPKLRAARRIKLLPIDVAMFAYEPVLKAMQDTLTLPLASEILYWNQSRLLALVEKQVPSLVDALRKNPAVDLKRYLTLPKSIILDGSQSSSFLLGLTQTVSIIQGPPGYVC